MDFKIFFSDEALNNLAAVVDYIAQDNPEAAGRVGRSLIKHTKILENWPEESGSLSALPITSTIAYYRIHADRGVVEILHFWHGARMEPRLLGGP